MQGYNSIYKEVSRSNNNNWYCQQNTVNFNEVSRSNNNNWYCQQNTVNFNTTGSNVGRPESGYGGSSSGCSQNYDTSSFATSNFNALLGTYQCPSSFQQQSYLHCWTSSGSSCSPSTGISSSASSLSPTKSVQSSQFSRSPSPDIDDVEAALLAELQKGQLKVTNDYICESCYLPGHHVKYCPRAAKRVALTPYQGTKPCYGEFKCKWCGREWNSQKSAANTSEKCNKCNSDVFPHKQQDLEKMVKSNFMIGHWNY